MLFQQFQYSGGRLGQLARDIEASMATTAYSWATLTLFRMQGLSVHLGIKKMLVRNRVGVGLTRSVGLNSTLLS